MSKIQIKKGGLSVRVKREKMTSTPVQFTDKQYEVSEKAMLQDGIKYFSEHVRNALDFYHQAKYPQLVK